MFGADVGYAVSEAIDLLVGGRIVFLELHLIFRVQ